MTSRDDVMIAPAAMISGPDGGDRFRAMIQAAPHRPVAVEAISEDEPYAFAALQLGARGCILTNWPSEQRLEAMTELGDGGVVLTPYLARCMLVYLTRPLAVTLRRRDRELTEPEATVLYTIGSGATGRELASRLGIDREAVRAYLRGALEKLQQRGGCGDSGLQGTGVPRRPSPGSLMASAEADPDDET
jgi:two-component system response regulator NreC